MKSQKEQEIQDQRDRKIGLSAAQLLWDMEEYGAAGDPPTLTLTWLGDWSSFNGQFLTGRRFIRKLVTVSWRYHRPPSRPNEDLVWDGKSWRSQLAAAEAQEASR